MATPKRSSSSDFRRRSSDSNLTELELTEIAGSLDPNDYLLLGVRLGFDKARLSQFKHNNPGDIAGAMASMLIRWRNDQSTPPRVVRKTLSDALKYVERSDLADTVYNGDAVVAETFSQDACADHPEESVSMFCRSCKLTICIHCVTLIHKTHDFVPLKIHRQEVEKRVYEKLVTINEIRSKSAELRAYLKTNRTQNMHSSTESLRDSVNKKCIASIQEFVDSNNKLLKQINFIECIDSDDIWDTVSSQLDTCTSLLGQEDAIDGYYENITECEKVMEAVTRLKDAVSNGGALTFIGNLEVKFVPTPEISLGHIEEPTGWRLVKKIDLPKDKAEGMTECIALSGRRVAVGYGSTRGVDIIGIDDEQRFRILEDTKIQSLLQITDGNLVVCDLNVSLSVHKIEKGGNPCGLIFSTKNTTKHSSLCVDSHKNIYMSYSEFKTIEVFDQSGGSPIRTIKTELEPWFISVMKTGHIAVTECREGIKDAVQVINQDGMVVCKIPGSDDHAPYSTCDQLGNIYVAMKHNDNGKVNIKKYSAQGEVLETVSDGLQTCSINWIQMSCVSPTEFVVCDRASVYVFQRRSTLTELMKLMM